MIDWEFELNDAAIVFAATFALIFLPEFAAPIFIFALILGACRAISQKSPVLKIPWHWLILAATGFFAQTLAIRFFAAYSALRFCVALIRYEESKEILRETQNLQELHQTEIKNLRRDSESKLQNEIGELELKHLRDKLNLRAELQERLMRKKNEPPS